MSEAIEQYRQALRIDPRFIDAQIDLVTALFAKGELEEAKAHYREATRLDPKLAQPHNYLGKIFMREGNAPHAIAQFDQALHLHPDFPEAEENLRPAKASDFPSQTPQ
jgi:tetratricopeptide (TPR) repeat protein